MSKIKHPSLLIDLGHVGEHGLPLNPAPWFRQELELCKEWGFRLNISNDRVRLDFDHDQLVPYWIQKETPAIAWDWLRVNGFFRIESTNDEALEQARQKAPGGTLIFTEEQTEGKGRNGHKWYSTARTGLDCSIILRPTQPLENWPLLTHVAAVALIETLKDLHARNISPHQLNEDIKWPNDVLLSGKKCAGILLETLLEGENCAAVIGIGINVHKGSVPESLSNTATYLDEMACAFVPRRQLLVLFLHNLQLIYLMFERGNHVELLDRWKSHSSMWNGKEVWIGEEGQQRLAVTCGLNDIGALLVRSHDGKSETIIAGNVKIKDY